MNRPRVPTVVWIGPFRIRVVTLSPRQLAEVLDEEEEPSEDRSPGGWVSEDVTIYLDKTLSIQRRWEIFCHEVAHAAIDFARRTLRTVGG